MSEINSNSHKQHPRLGPQTESITEYNYSTDRVITRGIITTPAVFRFYLIITQERYRLVAQPEFISCIRCQWSRIVFICITFCAITCSSSLFIIPGVSRKCRNDNHLRMTVWKALNKWTSYCIHCINLLHYRLYFLKVYILLTTK